MPWSASNQGPWNPAGMGMDLGSGPFGHEQWALMQQQNWQQWTQWQQQYSQWQNQYGDKYAQQLQAVQSVGGIPPPPPTEAAPPLPPEKPPPPPPHENNQPLFNSNKDKPAPPNNPPQKNNSNYKTNSETGNNQRSYSTDKQQPAVNAEDLKKLTEEEKLFDSQFKKWEEEIDKWRQENGNHPDKQAYKDYENKFLACRSQLMERRQQMKIRRAKLLNNPQANSTVNTTIPPPLPKNIQNLQPPNSQNNSYERYQSSQQSNERNIKNIEPQDRYESYHQNDSENNTYSHGNQAPQGSKSGSSTFLPTPPSPKGIPGLDLVPESHGNKKQDVIDLSSDQPEGQQGQAPDYSTISMGINNILGDEKIMNILSMVRGLKPVHEIESGNANSNAGNNDLPFLPNNQGNRNQNFSQRQQYGERQNNMPNRPGQFMQQNQDTNSQFQTSNQGGNYNRQNQGQYFEQNNQYGGPNSGPHGPGGNNRPREDGPSGPYGPGMHQGGPGMRPNGPGMRMSGSGMRPNGPSMLQGGPGGMRPSGHGMQQGVPGMRPGLNMNQGGSSMRPSGPGMQQGGPHVRPSGPGMQQSGTSMRPSGPGMHQSSDMRQSGQNMQQGGQNMQQGGQNIQQGGQNMQQGGQNIQQGGQNMHQGGQNMQHSGSNMQKPPPPLMANRISMPANLNKAPERSPLQDVSSQQNADYGGAQKSMSAVPQQPKSKWVEDPLFTPSIVVEYNHKSLRQKARDFIEPVHTFDYNHISKDDEFKKKDFEHEGDELFTRKPRRSERDYTDYRFRDQGSRDLYQRDYERRAPRDDFRDMPRESREARDMREPRDIREPRDMREPRDIRGEPRDVRGEPRDRDMREPRDFREPRDARREEPKGLRESDRVRDDMNPRDRQRDETRDDYERRRDDRNDERRRDDRDRYGNRRVVNNDHRDRERERRERRENRLRSTSIDNDREKDSRKRALSRESDVSDHSKKSKDTKVLPLSHPVVMIDDLLEPPGRSMRPEKIVIILRGLPGSGKSYLAKLIRDREAEHGGTARIMSIDDYFMQEGEIEETDSTTGKTIKKPSLKYEYDAASEETYINSLKRAFKRTITDGYFSFLIYDAVNVSLKSYADIWNFARQNGFQVYICVMEQDIQACFKRNIHNRTLEDLQVIATCFFTTPSHHIQLDATTLLQSAAITDVQMEDVNEVVEEDLQEEEVESVFTSKWEKMDDASQLARLDGTSKPLRSSQLSMEEYLQVDDWTPNVAKPGKKTVRWADLEERRQQEKMRAIGFVVGQTDWNRMTDPTMGSSALTQTKYIERTKRN